MADAGATYLPAVGLSAANALAFVVGHAVWSIGVPIAIVEALARGRRTTPWLGPVGLSVTGALYLLGAVLIFRYMQRTEQFLAPVPWRLGAAVVAAGLVARWSRRAGWGDRHRLALAGGALLTYAWGGFLLSFLLGRTGPIHYLGDAALAAAAVALLTVTTRRLRREHDGQTRGPPAGSGSGAGSVDGGDENSRTR